MFMQFISVVEGTILGHGTAPVQQADSVVTDTATTGGLFGGGGMGFIVVYAAIIGLMWFLVIRPQRKRQKKQQEMQQGLKVGDSVVTNGGLYGKIVDIGQDVYVVEFGINKGVRIPIVKTEIAGVREPQLGTSVVAKE